MSVRIIHGETPAALADIPDESIDACVTDPPYGIGFMGKEWDTFRPGAHAERKLPKWDAGESHNPNVRGRSRSPAISPSQIEYDESMSGRRRFQAWTEQWAREVFRVLKPGGYLLCSGAPRSYHRMACGIEDAGFEVRDAVLWLFSQGFPKSHNLGCKCAAKSKAQSCVRRVPETDLQEALSARAPEDEVLQQGVSEQGLHREGAQRNSPLWAAESSVEGRGDVQAEQGKLHRPEVRPVSAGVHGDGAEGRIRDGASSGGGEATGAVPSESGGSASPGPQHAEQCGRESETVRKQQRAQESRGDGTCPECGGLIDWRGYGTALKPAWEPIIMARKPLIGTVAANVLEHGTGALNIDASRVQTNDSLRGTGQPPMSFRGENARPFHEASRDRRYADKGATNFAATPGPRDGDVNGRWPANVIHDGSDCVVAEFPDTSSGLLGPQHTDRGKGDGVLGAFQGRVIEQNFGGDTGSAARFFYCAKASRADRDDGMTGFEKKPLLWSSGEQSPGTFQSPNTDREARNFHPTVKPTELMHYLCKLVTPPGGTILDPFMGSGSTGRGAVLGGFNFIGVEREAEYVEIARARIRAIAPLFVDVA